jgi:hypothetical protein
VTGLLWVGKKKMINTTIKIVSRYFNLIKDWLPIDSLHKNACKIVQDSISAE